MIKRELFNLEAEQIILGTIILNNEYLNRVMEFLRIEDFYEPAHQKIYAQILHNIEASNRVANQVTLKQFFDSEPTLQSVDGANYLQTLLGAVSYMVDIAEYGHLVHDLSLERKLVVMAEDLVSRIYLPKEERISATQQIEIIEADIFKLSEHGNGTSDFKNVSHSVKETLEKAKVAGKLSSHISGISTGFIELDRILGGMQPSDLIILAARPAMGKTGLALNIAVNACKYLNKDSAEKKGVGFFSLEMSADQLASRMLSMESSVNSTKLRSGKLSQVEWESLNFRGDEISKLPLFIDESPALSISVIRSRTRRLVRKHNLKLLIIDYLQLIRGSFKRASDNRVQEVSEVTQALKAIAKEFNIPVLALSQLNRSVESRDDKRPQLSDLRDSGSIEQDADVVAFIYRESYYLQKKEPPKDNQQAYNEWVKKMNEIKELTEIIIAKQRNGPVGSLNLYFDAEYTRFGDTYK